MIGVLQRIRGGIAYLPAPAQILAALAICMFMLGVSPADANPRYAALVIDANNGQVLFSRYADERRYPASITKVMTLYLVFEEIDAGRLRLDTPLKVSANAAAQPPSKVGVRAGQTITVKDAIGVLVTKSANDVATVVAENVSGSVRAFAERMTRTARSIGMRNTVFRNPHGLPNSEQVTTARDIATMAMAIRQRFAHHYHFFSLRNYTYRGTTYRNHNRVLTQVSGVTGLKTGFIRASGFNLATTLEKDGRYLVAVVMGGRSGASRDAHMRDILATALPKATRGAGPMLVANAPVPQARPERDPSLPVPPRTASAMMVPSLSVPGTLINARAPAPQPEPQQVASLDPAAGMESGSTDATATPAAAGGNWVIQVGAFESEGLARAALDEMRGRFPDMLNAASPFTETVNTGTGTLWRARFAGFDQPDAEAACAMLEQRSVGCFHARN